MHKNECAPQDITDKESVNKLKRINSMTTRIVMNVSFSVVTEKFDSYDLVVP